MIVESLLVSPFGTNCFLAVCEETNRCAVIDPGEGAGRILERIAERGWTLDVILLTHGHADHVAAAGELKASAGVALLCHRADEFLLGSAAEQAAMFGWFVKAQVPSPDRFLEDGDTVQVGNLSFAVLHTPGHSPGGLCFVGGGVAFVGDLIFAGSVGRTDLPGGSTEQLLQSVREKIFTLPGETVLYTGHGPETTVEEEKNSNPFFRPGGNLLF
jgi:glyoxylase-like metal-dependent hydrolase (beta-lactamase superfamily II)